MTTFTKQLLVSCILATSLLAGAAEAACDRATIAPTAGRTYSVVADWRYFDRNGIDAIRPTGTGYKIACDLRFTPKGNGHVRAQITCPDFAVDSAGRITSFGKLPGDDLDAENFPYPLPFWLSQDQEFDLWDVLPRPNHELRRRGSSCIWDLVDLATEPMQLGLRHSPYLFRFSSDGKNFAFIGRRLTPGQDIGDVGEVVVGETRN